MFKSMHFIVLMLVTIIALIVTKIRIITKGSIFMGTILAINFESNNKD